MFRIFNRNLKRLCSRLRWPVRRRPKPKILIKKLEKSNSKLQLEQKDSSITNGSAAIHPNGSKSRKSIRIATFNASLFSMAPVIPKTESFSTCAYENGDLSKVRTYADVNFRTNSLVDRPKSILKQSPLHPTSVNSEENLTKQQKFVKSKLRVSINLPDNEISLKRSGQLSFAEDDKVESWKGKGQLRSSISMPTNGKTVINGQSFRSTRTVVEVLRELDADILALQDVKAEEEKDMKPLSDLAAALGMNYVFAESWAPEYGNAILSKWPIKRSTIQKIFDDSDFRNVLKATIDVPQTGDIEFHCTLLDHLDENWRMKQINAIIGSNDTPHILAGGLNSLDETDYSSERWSDIVKYYEEMGKPTPKLEVMRYLKSKQYTDAKDFAGECESVVMIAKGQSVQGTCKYGTRVDYVLLSPDSPYKFIPGSYSVFSSKGTSDHHIVKVDITKVDMNSQQQFGSRRRRKAKQQRIVKINNSSPSTKGIWKTNTIKR